MSRNIRRLASVGIGLIIIGSVTTLLGKAFGGRMDINDFSNGGYGIKISGNLDQEYMAPANQTEYSELDSFNSIDAEIEALDFKVQVSDRFAIDINNQSKGIVEYEVRGEKLIVKHDYPSNTINNSKGEIIVYMPEEVVIEALMLDNGVGETSIEGIEIEKAELNLGVGAVELIDVVTGKLDINGGVGSILGQGLVSYDTYVNVGVGEVSLEGSFIGDIDIQGGLGVVELITTENYSDYNYYVTKGLGDIEINDEYYSVLKNVDEDNGAPYTIDIEGGIGSIEINTH